MPGRLRFPRRLFLFSLVALACSLGSGGQALASVPGGTALAQYSDAPTGEGIANLIDGSASTKYLTFHSTCWVQVKLSAGLVATGYAITSANDEPTRDPKAWSLQGSSNGTSWTTLNSQANQSFSERFQKQSYTLTNATAYTYYRLNITANAGASICQLAELDLTGGGCIPSALTPYLLINGGAWQQTATASLGTGDSLKFGPQPISGGSWSWSGPAGFSAATREVQIANIQTSQAGAYMATYSNATGCKSTQNFNVSVTTTLPSAPANLLATAVSSNQINLTWTDTSSNETGFQLERSTDGASFSALASTAGNTASYSDAGLAALTRYYYRVRASNAAGNSAFAPVASALTQSGGCTAAAVVPYLTINGGAWQQTASANLAAGGSVILGPQPLDGTWAWSGPGGYSAVTREVTLSNLQSGQAGSYVATYTDAHGCKSSATFVVSLASGNGYSVSSPSGAITISVALSGGSLSYQVTRNGVKVFEPSALGLSTSIGDFSTGLSYLSRQDNLINESYSLPGHKKNPYLNKANEMVLAFSKGGQEMDLVVRAYDDGAAYRYRFPGSGAITINSENSHFNLPDGAGGWGANSYDDMFPSRSNFSSGNFIMPLTANIDGSTFALLAESDVCANYCSSSLNGSAGNDLSIAMGSSVSATRPFNSAWRMALIGGLAEITESTLVENLNSPSQLADSSWVKPGRSAWSWAAGGNQGDYSTATAYVDFAAAMGWEYYLCDEGWQESWVPSLVTYAKAKGVGIALWDKRDNFGDAATITSKISKWAGWGVKGIKIDYVFWEDQATMTWYDLVCRTAAQYQLVVNFHGCTKPNGMARRWPNQLTQENVFGAEQYGGTGPSAQHNCTLPFTRNAIGPMDYTPVTFAKALGTTTYAHQVALDVVFTSYIQHLADSASAYSASVAKDFLRTCPSVWDDSKFLEGFPGQYISIARRSGSDWYLGAICGGGISRTATLPLTFLDSGKTYTAQIYKDGSSDSSIVTATQAVSSTAVLSIPLRTNGGLAIRIVAN